MCRTCLKNKITRKDRIVRKVRRGREWGKRSRGTKRGEGNSYEEQVERKILGRDGSSNNSICVISV